MGIEPTSSAWKAEVLPLNYTREGLRAPARKGRLPSTPPAGWWWGEDSNLRRLSRQIYSLIPLTTREPHRRRSRAFSPAAMNMSMKEIDEPSSRQEQPSLSVPESSIKFKEIMTEPATIPGKEPDGAGPRRPAAVEDHEDGPASVRYGPPRRRTTRQRPLRDARLSTCRECRRRARSPDSLAPPWERPRREPGSGPIRSPASPDGDPALRHPYPARSLRRRGRVRPSPRCARPRRARADRRSAASGPACRWRGISR